MAARLKTLAYKKLFNPKRSARIYLGEDRDAWNLCGAESQRGYADLLLLPAGEDPFKYSWPVKNLDVLIFNTKDVIETTRLEKIILACLNAGASLVIALTASDMLVARP